MRWRPKFVRSLGRDPGHHEEVQNGPENKIHIREVDFWVSEKFGIFPVVDWKVLEGFGGTTCGPTTPIGAT